MWIEIKIFCNVFYYYWALYTKFKFYSFINVNKKSLLNAKHVQVHGCLFASFNFWSSEPQTPRHTNTTPGQSFSYESVMTFFYLLIVCSLLLLSWSFFQPFVVFKWIFNKNVHWSESIRVLKIFFNNWKRQFNNRVYVPLHCACVHESRINPGWEIQMTDWNSEHLRNMEAIHKSTSALSPSNKPNKELIIGYKLWNSVSALPLAYFAPACCSGAGFYLFCTFTVTQSLQIMDDTDWSDQVPDRGTIGTTISAEPLTLSAVTYMWSLGRYPRLSSAAESPLGPRRPPPPHQSALKLNHTQTLDTGT